MNKKVERKKRAGRGQKNKIIENEGVEKQLQALKGLEKRNQIQLGLNRRYKRQELAKNILKIIAAVGVLTVVIGAPGMAQTLKLFGAKNAKDRYRIKRALESTHKNGLIEITEKNGEQTVRLTEKGKEKTLQYSFESMEIIQPEKWDKKWRMIIFDIPEKHKRGRDALTQKLRDMRFYPLQKSTFVSPYECKEEIDFIGHLFGIRKYISYILADEIENDKDMREYYVLDTDSIR